MSNQETQKEAEPQFVVLPLSDLQEVSNYLATKPFNEVAMFISKISKAKIVQLGPQNPEVENEDSDIANAKNLES